VLHFPTT